MVKYAALLFNSAYLQCKHVPCVTHAAKITIKIVKIKIVEKNIRNRNPTIMNFLFHFNCKLLSYWGERNAYVLDKHEEVNWYWELFWLLVLMLLLCLVNFKFWLKLWIFYFWQTIPEEMPSLSGAQLDTVHCEASSTMIGETQSLSSQSS